MTGHSDHSGLSDHIVIIGYNRQTTLHLVQLLLGDRSETRPILLASTSPTENPLPSDIAFVRSDSITDQDLIRRAGVVNASLVIAFGHDDSETLSAALAACAYNPKAHFVAYFNTQSTADVLRLHCPQAEIIVSLKVENLVRAAQDPGSSRLAAQLLSPFEGQTIYSATVPKHCSVRFNTLFDHFKHQHHAVVLGYSLCGNDTVILNPQEDAPLNSFDRLYYIAAQRIDEKRINWESNG